MAFNLGVGGGFSPEIFNVPSGEILRRMRKSFRDYHHAKFHGARTLGPAGGRKKFAVCPSRLNATSSLRRLNMETLLISLDRKRHVASCAPVFNFVSPLLCNDIKLY